MPVLELPAETTVAASGDTVTVRAASAADYDAANILFKAQLGDGFTLDYELWQAICTADSHHVLVATVGDSNEIAGLAVVIVSDRIRLAHGTRRRRFHLDHLIVLPTFRRHGIGNRLLKEVIAVAEAQKPSYIIVNCEFTNVAARKTYESAGLYLVRQASDRFEIAFS
ncbi:MAG: GNAT family N-acetyltransferase [Armatimonadetes bacterium]|nr:GNAT family N-acetyltransferase [Armatimonadota bacterium]